MAEWRPPSGGPPGSSPFAPGAPTSVRSPEGGYSNNPHDSSGFTVQAFEFTGNVAGGGVASSGAPSGGQSPFAASYGTPPAAGHPHNVSPTQMPTLHPGLPESIWVLDPLTRKLKVPTNLIVPTAATATLGSTPSLCIAFLENRCRHPWCRQAHVPLHVVQRLRMEAQNAPTCCNFHRNPHEIGFLVSRFKSVDISFNNGTKVPVPTSRFAVTVGLQRHLAQVVPKSKTGPTFEVSSRMICRLHLGHRCRYLEDCNNLHVCRDLDDLQRAFAENTSDRSPVGAGQPSSHQGTPTPTSQHSTPLASGAPAHAAAPPKYTDATGRSPPFGGGLPPPSPLMTPVNSFTPNVGTPSLGASNPYSGQHAAGGAGGHLGATPLVPPNVAQQHQHVVNLVTLNASSGSIVMHNNRPYAVQQLRAGAVSDAEFAHIAEAHQTMYGGPAGGKVETLDFCATPRQAGTSSSTAAADIAAAFAVGGPMDGPGSSMTALPPPLNAHESPSRVIGAAAGGGAGGWKMDPSAPAWSGGGTPVRERSTVTSAWSSPGGSRPRPDPGPPGANNSSTAAT